MAEGIYLNTRLLKDNKPPREWIDIFSLPLNLQNHKVKKIDSGYGMFIQ